MAFNISNTVIFGDISTEEMFSQDLLAPEAERLLGQRVVAGRAAGRALQSPQLSAANRAELEGVMAEAEAAVAELVEANIRLVMWVTAKYYGYDQNNPPEDLVQEGVLGLYKALTKWDPALGRFSTYATMWVRQVIGRYVKDMSRTVRLPVGFQDLQRRVKKATAAFEQEHGRRPRLEELAERANIPLSKVKDLLRHLPHARSLEEPVGNDPESDYSLGDIVFDEMSEPERILEWLQSPETALALINACPNRQWRAVMVKYVGLEDGQSYTMEEVGQGFGLTRSRIQQIVDDFRQWLLHPARASLLRDAGVVLPKARPVNRPVNEHVRATVRNVPSTPRKAASSRSASQCASQLKGKREAQRARARQGRLL